LSIVLPCAIKKSYGLTVIVLDELNLRGLHSRPLVSLDATVMTPPARGTRIKRLMRKTICFSKSIQMHDIVIGLFVNRHEFGLLLYGHDIQI
jgi:hypothetical protein